MLEETENIVFYSWNTGNFIEKYCKIFPYMSGRNFLHFIWITCKIDTKLLQYVEKCNCIFLRVRVGDRYFITILWHKCSTKWSTYVFVFEAQIFSTFQNSRLFLSPFLNNFLKNQLCKNTLNVCMKNWFYTEIYSHISIYIFCFCIPFSFIYAKIFHIA